MVLSRYLTTASCRIDLHEYCAEATGYLKKKNSSVLRLTMLFEKEISFVKLWLIYLSIFYRIRLSKGATKRATIDCAH